MYAAEPANADDCARSLEAGKLLPMTSPPQTIADALRLVQECTVLFSIQQLHFLLCIYHLFICGLKLSIQGLALMAGSIKTSQQEIFIISVFLAMYEAIVYNSLLDILFTKYPAIAFHISFYPRVSSAP